MNANFGDMLQGWAAARSQSRRLMTRLRLSYRQRATWQGRRQGAWMNGSRLARRVFGNQTEVRSEQFPRPSYLMCPLNISLEPRQIPPLKSDTPSFQLWMDTTWGQVWCAHSALFVRWYSPL